MLPLSAWASADADASAFDACSRHSHHIDLEPAACFSELLCAMLISCTIVQRVMSLLSGY